MAGLAIREPIHLPKAIILVCVVVLYGIFFPVFVSTRLMPIKRLISPFDIQLGTAVLLTAVVAFQPAPDVQTLVERILSSLLPGLGLVFLSQLQHPIVMRIQGLEGTKEDLIKRTYVVRTSLGNVQELFESKEYRGVFEAEPRHDSPDQRSISVYEMSSGPVRMLAYLKGEPGSTTVHIVAYEVTPYSILASPVAMKTLEMAIKGSIIPDLKGLGPVKGVHDYQFESVTERHALKPTETKFGLLGEVHWTAWLYLIGSTLFAVAIYFAWSIHRLSFAELIAFSVPVSGYWLIEVPRVLRPHRRGYPE